MQPSLSLFLLDVLALVCFVHWAECRLVDTCFVDPFHLSFSPFFLSVRVGSCGVGVEEASVHILAIYIYHLLPSPTEREREGGREDSG